MDQLGHHTWTEVTRLGSPPLLAIPVGSCEQHGPHLPLDTDTRIAIAVTAGLAARNASVLVGPAITIGASGEHDGFAGTLSIGVAALRTVLVEIARSADWSGGVIFVNGHGGNHATVRAATAQLVAEGRRALAWSPSIPGGDAHAGRTETSLMLAIAPELVHLDHAAAGRTEPLAELLDELVAHGIASISLNGVLGDPAGANADEGALLLRAMIDDVERCVTTWQT